jgi:quercetin dioxygenase-like cupin family protein
MALHHAGPGEKVRLLSLASAPAGMETAALVKTDVFETVQLVLESGQTISPHSVPGYAILHCLEGDLILDAAERIELKGGDWIYLDRREQHSLTALEHSSILLTILFED